MTLRDRISDELLPRVKQPGQYIGGEWNQLVRSGDWQRAELRVALAFPDTYAVGMSHLGCQILYWLCNHTSGVCAERVYCPWTDAEQVMRERGIPLFTWDTRQPVASADILAVSIQYEMSFANLLMLLDLAGIPLRSGDRDERHPLVIVGGPQVDNPEPIADFVDAVVIGDGEASMAAILDASLELKRAGTSRFERLVELARRFEWLYVPSLYQIRYHDDGTIAAMTPASSCPAGFVPRQTIGRCPTKNLDDAPLPLRPIVPFTEVVHDRISIEIMRGCPKRCRFCHAGYTKRPMCIRSVDRLVDIAESAWLATGHNEIGLLSLSSADYPKLRELAQRMNERFAPRHVNLSLPSLRVDKMLSDIPWLVSSVRKSGLTIAVEAASQEMREAIRKEVLEGDLIEGIRQAYKAGWNSVKLYFMCGFPGETESDIRGIFDLALQVSHAKRAVRGGPASVNASVSWLVPKPHTPLQWAPMQTAEYFHETRHILLDASRQRRSAVHIKTHRVDRSILEGVFARGDRRLARVVETAYHLGARMDGWDETFDNNLWLKAFETTGIDPAFYAHRSRPYSEILPWDHIESGSPRPRLATQYDDLQAKCAARAAPSGS
ncbi:MAG: TIGR03960 family B12-binding radical SAM protein [Planctomycetes bacterium]|nr:TIGR03960 family B12-binding radical SAM protein [Planctomycetota bacterium]